MPLLDLGGRRVGDTCPVCFIADIAANHDGSLDRAVELIHLAAAAGADVAKFQNFKAQHIVSDLGFKALAGSLSHQKHWKKSVYSVYEEASLDDAWTPTLAKACTEAGILYATTPYDSASLRHALPYMPFVKIGSGDITWLESLEEVARCGKPVLLATGASTLFEVQTAAEVILRHTPQLALLQCNTNYTGASDNFRCVNLRVLQTFRALWPDLVLGLSDHTPGHAAVLGAVTLGARIIEKHFTDDTSRSGPDHPFSMTPRTWREMVDRTRELEAALGDGVKRVEANEQDTVVVQRRALRARRTLAAGTRLRREDFEALRPCPREAWPLHLAAAVEGQTLLRTLEQGDHLLLTDLLARQEQDRV